MGQTAITDLPLATLPLAGTESVPIVQNGITVQATTGAIASSTAQIPIDVDNTTPTAIHPLMAQTPAGTVSTLYTSYPRFQYVPATGELRAPEVSATNGIFTNNSVINTNYTVPTNYNALSAGPMTINAAVTVPAGSVWTVL